MPDITREEIDAKTATTEAKSQTQFAILNGKLDAMAAHFRGRFDAMAERLDGQALHIGALEQAVTSLKTTVIVTGISSVIAIVLGVATFNATLLSNMTATFQAGKDVATTQAEVRRQVEATAALLRQIQREHPPATPPEK